MIDGVIEIPKGGFVSAEGELKRLAENLALRVSDTAAKRGATAIRQDMQAAGLRGLSRAIGHTSDLKKGTGVFRRGSTVSASGVIYIRSRSQRTVGAVISYTEGANILPKRGRYLWVPTDEIRRIARVPIPRTGGGRGTAGIRLEPRYWKRLGLDRKVGPLVRIVGKNGLPLLIVKNVGVNAGGRKRSARSLTKAGRPRKGDVLKNSIVAFIAIPSTSRQARVNPLLRAGEAVRFTRQELGG